MTSANDKDKFGFDGGFDGGFNGGEDGAFGKIVPDDSTNIWDNRDAKKQRELDEEIRKGRLWVLSKRVKFGSMSPNE